MLRDDIVIRAQNGTGSELIPVEASETDQGMACAPYQPMPLTAEDASSLRTEYLRAGIRTAAAKAEADEFIRRKFAEAEAKAYEKQLRQQIKDDAEDQNEMKSLRVYETFNKIKMDIIRPDGRISRPKNLVDEDFVEAKKYISYEGSNEGIVCLTFLKKGYPVQILYSDEMVVKSYADLVAILRAHGLHVNLSRRLKTEAEEQLYYFFEEIAEKVELPKSYGYYQKTDGAWGLAIPGNLTMNSLVGGNSDV